MENRKSVQGGYCDMQGCALTKLECDDPADFVSSRQMRDIGVRGHGGECRWQDTVKTTQLGMCFESDSTTATECASTIEACSEWDLSEGMVHQSNGFVPQVPECSVETTNFGRCSDGMCAWDPKHCLDDHSWTPFDRDCTCDQVQVGACSRSVTRDGREGREVFCAVSEDACDAEQTWIPPRDVKGMAGFECFLCREEAPPSESPTRPSSIKDASPAALPGVDLGGPRRGISSQTTVVVVSTVGAAFAVLILGIVGYNIFAWRTARAAAAAKEDVPPFSSIQIPSESDCEAGGPCTDTDNASVLSDGSQE